MKKLSVFTLVFLLPSSAFPFEIPPVDGSSALQWVERAVETVRQGAPQWGPRLVELGEEAMVAGKTPEHPFVQGAIIGSAVVLLGVGYCLSRDPSLQKCPLPPSYPPAGSGFYAAPMDQLARACSDSRLACFIATPDGKIERVLHISDPEQLKKRVLYLGMGIARSPTLDDFAPGGDLFDFRISQHGKTKSSHHPVSSKFKTVMNQSDAGRRGNDARAARASAEDPLPTPDDLDDRIHQRPAHERTCHRSYDEGGAEFLYEGLGPSRVPTDILFGAAGGAPVQRPPYVPELLFPFKFPTVTLDAIPDDHGPAWAFSARFHTVWAQWATTRKIPENTRIGSWDLVNDMSFPTGEKGIAVHIQTWERLDARSPKDVTLKSWAQQEAEHSRDQERGSMRREAVQSTRQLLENLGQRVQDREPEVITGSFDRLDHWLLGYDLVTVNGNFPKNDEFTRVVGQLSAVEARRLVILLQKAFHDGEVADRLIGLRSDLDRLIEVLRSGDLRSIIDG